MGPEFWWHASELATLLAMAFKVIRAANRIMDVMRDFPPHRHINGHVIYPEGYEPTRVEQLKHTAGH